MKDRRDNFQPGPHLLPAHAEEFAASTAHVNLSAVRHLASLHDLVAAVFDLGCSSGHEASAFIRTFFDADGDERRTRAPPIRP